VRRYRTLYQMQISKILVLQVHVDTLTSEMHARGCESSVIFVYYA
jgi:hypothetical protein